MSQIHYQPVDLTDVIRFSSLVVVVRKDSPDHSIEQIPIHADAEKYPPFGLYKSHYVAIEVIKGSGLSAGQKFSVVPATYDEDLHIHKEYYLNGLGISPIYQQYQSKSYQNSDEEFIIFLRPGGEQYAFTVVGAIEGLAMKEEIQQTIDKLKDEPGYDQPVVTPIE